MEILLLEMLRMRYVTVFKMISREDIELSTIFFGRKELPVVRPFSWFDEPIVFQIQEQLYHDPWRLLVATIFLNKTSGKAATPLVWKFFERWPDAHAAKRADPHHIAALMQPLGLHQLRATRIIRMSSTSSIHQSQILRLPRFSQIKNAIGYGGMGSQTFTSKSLQKDLFVEVDPQGEAVLVLPDP